MSKEREEAIALANRVLDKPYIDPDSDICLLARQFLRALEAQESLTKRLDGLTKVVRQRERLKAWSLSNVSQSLSGS